MQAALRLDEGLVAAAADPVAAKPCFEDSIELWMHTGAQFEAARARVELAHILSRLDRRTAALKEVSKAAESLHAIGSMRAANRAQTLARELARATAPAEQ